ncbi:type II toxin -antitoxin system TacA 1-like antitoxin [Pseudomonas bubulae]
MHLVELDAACKRAEEVILDQRVFVLEGADFDAFA